MKLRYIIILLMLVAVSAPYADAQTDTQLTQYWAVQNYYNPAATGVTDFINIRGGTRMQWVGITNAPKTFLVAAESPFKLFNKRFGAGLVMNQESIGLYKTLNFNAQISYKLKLFKGTLSIGAQFGFVDESFKGSEVILPDGTGGESADGGSSSETVDPETGVGTGTDTGVPTTDVRGNAFDLGFGIHYTHKYFWAALSGTHLLEPTLNMSTEGNEDKLYEAQLGRMLYFMGGCNIPIKNTLFELQPSVLVRSNFKITQAEITARVRYKKFLSFGVAYRTNDAVSVLLGAEYKNFFAGYSYDYATSAISKVSSGSHEIFVGYSLKLNLGDKNKNKHKSIRIM